jgi:tetratricopeptide (TPR) repeat protein
VLLLTAVCLFSGSVSLAHPDLELQIGLLTTRISEQPGDAELYLRRGDLYRRHEDWERAAGDFEKARDLNPQDPLIDWYEGRLKSESGQLAEGDRLLSRFLRQQPGHAGAYQARALTRWRLGKPQAAAEDYSRAISESERPAPVLYRSLVIAQISSGDSFSAAAAETVAAGLARFPAEVSLLGLGFDLALSHFDIARAKAYLAQLPRGLFELPQWGFRQALLDCQEGRLQKAAKQLEALIAEPGQAGSRRAGTWNVPRDVISQLAAEPGSVVCREAAAGMLSGLQP